MNASPLPNAPDPPDRQSDVSRLLTAASAGDAGAARALLPIVYRELRALAQHHMAGERAGHTLQATALVHEVYLKLVGPGHIEWTSKAQFFFAAAESMRRVLIDHARARARLKRGGGGPDRRVIPSDSLNSLENLADLASQRDPEEILAFNTLFQRLEAHEPRFAAVVRLRFYAGLSVEQTARSLGVSERTVNNDWLYARAWLARALRDGFSEENRQGTGP